MGIQNIKMYSTNWCADCLRAKRFFNAHNIQFEEINISKDKESAEIVRKINNGNESVPTIIITYNDGSTKISVEPNHAELEELFLNKI